MALVTITPKALEESAAKFRTDLLSLPVIAASATLSHMTPRPGITRSETVGQISGDIDIGPYDPNRVDDTGVKITGRTLDVYLGSVIKHFDVNAVAGSVYGILQAQGKSLAEADVTRSVLDYLSGQLGKKLNMAIWSAKRNSTGTKTVDLFDGFDTITNKEIETNGTISESAGNLFLHDDITNSNARDVLNKIYGAASDELQGEQTKMFVPFDVYRAYNENYAMTMGGVPYNTEYKKTFLDGSQGLCEIVPLASKKGSKYIHLTTQGNMLYGYGAGLGDENIQVMDKHELLLSFVATMYFGVQFESISPERLLVATVKND